MSRVVPRKPARFSRSACLFVCNLLNPVVLLVILVLSLSLPVYATNVGGTISEDTTWTLEGSPYIVTSDIVVNSGKTLTIGGGVVVKMGSSSSMRRMTVNGTLDCQGSSGNEVVFTSLRDNSVGGVTGTGNPVGGDWGQILLNTGTTNLHHVIMRYGGYWYSGDNRDVYNGYFYQYRLYTLWLNGVSPTVSNCVIDTGYSGSYGIYSTGVGQTPTISNNVISGSSYGLMMDGSTPSVTGNTFSGNNGWPIYEVNGANPVYSGNTFSGPSSRGIAVSGTIDQAVTWENVQGLGLPYVALGDITINSGKTLTIGGGVVVKMGSSSSMRRMTVNGTLDCQGSSGNEVVFTSLRDNSVGGVTGTGNPVGGDWGQILLNTGTTNLHHVIMRYGGYWYSGDNRDVYNGYFYQYRLYTLWLNGVSPTISNCIISSAYNYGIYISGSDQSPTITGCHFFNNPIGLYVSGTNNPTITNNSFLLNTTAGLSNQTGSQITAENNWWGRDGSGPYHATQNSSGKGDAVVGNVDFTPWSTSAPVPMPILDTYVAKISPRENEVVPLKLNIRNLSSQSVTSGYVSATVSTGLEIVTVEGANINPAIYSSTISNGWTIQSYPIGSTIYRVDASDTFTSTKQLVDITRNFTANDTRILTLYIKRKAGAIAASETFYVRAAFPTANNTYWFRDPANLSSYTGPRDQQGGPVKVTYLNEPPPDIAHESVGNGKYTITWTKEGSGKYIRAFFRQSTSVPWSSAPEIRGATYGNIYVDDKEQDVGSLTWNSKIITYADADIFTPIINYNNSVQVKIDEYDANGNILTTHTSGSFPVDNSIGSKSPIFLVHGINNVADDMKILSNALSSYIDLLTNIHTPSLTDYDIWSFEYPNQQRFDYSGKLLKNAIGAFGQFVPDKKIKLVAYSLGGIVCRWYLEEREDPDISTSPLLYINGSVDKLIMLGTPNGGSYPGDFMYHLSFEQSLTDPSTSNPLSSNPKMREEVQKAKDVFDSRGFYTKHILLHVAYKEAVDNLEKQGITTFFNKNFKNEAAKNMMLSDSYYKIYNEPSLLAKLNGWRATDNSNSPHLNGDVEYGVIAGTVGLKDIKFIKFFGILYAYKADVHKFFSPNDDNDIVGTVRDDSLDGVLKTFPVTYHHKKLIGQIVPYASEVEGVPPEITNRIITWIKNPIGAPLPASENLYGKFQAHVDPNSTTTNEVGNGVKMTLPPNTAPSGSTAEMSMLKEDNSKIAMLSTATAKTAKKPIDNKSVFDFSVKDASGNKITSFGNSVRLDLPYQDADGNGIVDGTGYSASSLKLSYLDENTQQLVQVSSTVDATNKTVWANVSHFSIYVIVSDSNTISDTALSVKIEGRGDDRSGINIAVYNAGGDTQSEGYTDSSGAFELQAISDGSYTIKIKEARTLRMSGTMTVSGGKITNFTFSRTTLKGGDANNDNYVTDADYSILAPAWMTQSGNSKYDARADFNNDGYITDADYSVLAPNWMKSGD